MSRQIEEWRPIKDYEGLYEVSDWGRVKSIPHFVKNGNGFRLTKEKILKTFLAGKNKDYHYLKLHKNGEQEPFEISRLVAETWIPNPKGKPQVDHISGDKNDNSKWNLRWCTQPENLSNEVTKSQRLNNPKTSKVIYLYTLDYELVKIYPSLHEAERDGYGRKEINKCCLGLLKTHKGHIWSYKPL